MGLEGREGGPGAESVGGREEHCPVLHLSGCPRCDRDIRTALARHFQQLEEKQARHEEWLKRLAYRERREPKVPIRRTPSWATPRDRPSWAQDPQNSQ